MTGLPFGAVDVDCAARAAHDVVHELDIADGRLRRVLLLIADREEQGRAVLPARPVVRHQVAVHKDALRVLQLELIFDDPAFAAPTQRLVEVVAAHDDVRGHDAHARGRAAEEDALRRRLDVVVDDLERAGAGPAADGLALVALAFEVCEVAVEDAYGAAVGGDAAALAFRRVAVKVAAVELDVVRQFFGRVLLAASEQDDVAFAVRGRAELDADEAVVVRARRGLDGRSARHVGDNLRQHGGVARRVEPLSRGGQLRVRRGRADGDEVRAALLVRELERAAEGRARFEHDRVAGPRAVERRLTVAAGLQENRRRPRHGARPLLTSRASSLRVGEREARDERRGDDDEGGALSDQLSLHHSSRFFQSFGLRTRHGATRLRRQAYGFILRHAPLEDELVAAEADAAALELRQREPARAVEVENLFRVGDLVRVSAEPVNHGE